MKRFSSLVSVGVLLFGALPAFYVSEGWAAASDPLIEGAKQCTKYLPRYEREYAIPTHLLSAIASTESGRYHDGLKLKLPWPWTINANGKGYYFDTKEEAIAAVHKLRLQGIQSIDVGCMQVNLYHHPDAFLSLDQAFEPKTNIAYAASFLHNLYSQDGTWKKAAADYHSKTPTLGNQYVDLVYDSWFTIIERLRAARLAVPDDVVATANELRNGSHVVIPRVITVANTEENEASAVQPAALPEQEGRRVASYSSPHMKVVQVRDADVASAESVHKNHGVLVITPDSSSSQASKQPEIITADARSVASPNVQPPVAENSAPVPNVIPIADHSAGVASVQVHRSGPNFIFEN